VSEWSDGLRVAPASAEGYTQAVNRAAGTALLVVAMVIVIVVVDVLFLRDRFWPRLVVNIGVVALAAVVYLTVLRK
jgi:hypothetical protein